MLFGVGTLYIITLSPIIGIFLSINGTTAYVPIKCLKRSSLGLTAIAASPNIVSGLTVAMVIPASASGNLLLSASSN